MATLRNAEFFSLPSNTEKVLFRKIDNLGISADGKALLAELLRLSSQVGQQLFRIGRKILDFIFLTIDQFPTLTFSTIAALVVGALLSSVPLIGALLSSVLVPLALALGITYGVIKEVGSPDLDERIRAFTAGFREVLA